MKTAILERTVTAVKPSVKLPIRQVKPVDSPTPKPARRAIRPRHWDGEFNGMWCDEDWY